ncbi:uncharacterized protein LOC110703866 [Chenopodium quinoa]|uniref:uncharacterized protein LOC110703866 n=1 Tax=Chenopodium quinoa TaxID=63459 RepID=UPI000B794185|nr:uncharacterized protein LOC110703866 [Chenopodium quinoa]
MTFEMIDTLQERVDIVETEAKLAQLKQEKAEDRARVVIDSFNTFCAKMEKDVFPQADEGEALLKAFGAVDVPSLKAKIQHKIDTEVQSQVLAREEISRQKIKILEADANQHRQACERREKDMVEAGVQLESQRQSITSLEVQLKNQEEQLSQARDKAEQTEQRLADAEAQLKEQRESSQKALDEVQKKLADAEAQLALRIYTQAEYSTAYLNGYGVARRLALHAAPDLDWYQCEIWAEDPKNPHMQQASQAEVDLLARLLAEDAAAKEAEMKEAEVQAPVQPASSAAEVDAALDSNLAGRPDPSAEA